MESQSATVEHILALKYAVNKKIPFKVCPSGDSSVRNEGAPTTVAGVPL